jgi:hypothetical protein
MGYVDGFKAIESTFTSAYVVDDPGSIDQSGEFLYFDGVKPLNKAQDKISAVVIVASQTLVGESGAIAKLEELREVLRSSRFAIEFEFVKRADYITNTLFTYAIGVSIVVDVYKTGDVDEVDL